MDKLTVEYIEAAIKDCKPHLGLSPETEFHQVYSQLLDIMRENERLYESIGKIEELAASLQAECRIKAKTYKEMMNWSHDHIANEILTLCGELDNRNKDSNTAKEMAKLGDALFKTEPSDGAMIKSLESIGNPNKQSELRIYTLPDASNPDNPEYHEMVNFIQSSKNTLPQASTCYGCGDVGVLHYDGCPTKTSEEK